MKKGVLSLLVFFISLSFSAQESVVLRYNYKKGDNYKMEMSMKQNMGIMGGMDMKMIANVKIVATENGKTTMTSQMRKVDTEVMQGGQTMKYNSETKEEELDAFGKQMKTQMDPLMKAITIYTFDKYGKVLETKIEPNIPQAGQAQEMSLNHFPEEAVKVGSTWTNEQDQQGMKMKMIYTVKQITSTSVIVDISGTVDVMSNEGKLTGSTTIDKATGNSDVINLSISITAQGMTVSTTSTVEMIKQ